MSQQLIRIGFDIHSEMSLDEIVQALKFCPIAYDVDQLDPQHFFLKLNIRIKNSHSSFLE